MNRKKIILSLASAVICCSAFAQSVDYSIVSVGEEARLELEVITSDDDHVTMPIVQRSKESVAWLSNKIIDTSTDGASIAFLSSRNNRTNVFVKDLKQLGQSVQRTDRGEVFDFSFSPNGRYITFSERFGDKNSVFRTDAEGGFTCRQLTENHADYSPCFSSDMKRILFVRAEQGNYGICSYNMLQNVTSDHTSGYNPSPIPSESAYLCVRVNSSGYGEIWRVDYNTGAEKRLVSDRKRSFTTPVMSPNGAYIVFVGSSPIQVNKTTVYWNTDIFVCRADGSGVTQLTYHAADDLSPTWSQNSKYIYFISQRGSLTAAANVWRMSFNRF